METASDHLTAGFSSVNMGFINIGTHSGSRTRSEISRERDRERVLILLSDKFHIPSEFTGLDYAS